MSPVPTELWPWLALAGLGAFHGLNPAMGWLFAVALGLHRHSRRIVWLSPLPVALGHALSIAMVAGVFLWAGFVIDLRAVRIGAGLFLIGWAFYHWRYGHRHRVRVGMQAGLAALAVWSFLMATTHGAGLMLWPLLMPLCFPAASQPSSIGPVLTALLAMTSRLRVPAARCARAMRESFGPKKQRAQGMPGARCTRSLACEIKQSTRA